jgi:hypothetical protein
VVKGELGTARPAAAVLAGLAVAQQHEGAADLGPAHAARVGVAQQADDKRRRDLVAG